MRRLFHHCLASFAAAVGLSQSAAGAEPDPVQLEFFESKVRPILVDHCYSCHSAAAEKLKGELRLDTRAAVLKGGENGPVLVPGKPDESRLIKAVRYDDPDLQMPPKGKKLSPEQIAALETWVRMGAPDPRNGDATELASAAAAKSHWAFQRPIPPPIPPTRNPAWHQTTIDGFVLAPLEAQGLTPSPKADRRTLIRRATFDVTGLPPTPEEVADFEQDRSPTAFERVVDRLLASPRYGERWGRHWLDVARYADTKGYVFEEERRYAYSYTYRDWVIEALNRDLPYDEFLVAQIAGDLVATESDKRPLAALGFLTLGRRFLNNPHDIIDDRLDVVFRGLQAMTVGCARCHDHKFDPIPIADYYSLYGVFAGTHEPDPKPLISENPNPALRAAYETARVERTKERDDFKAAKVQQARRELRSKVADYLLVLRDAQGNDKREEFIRSRQLSPAVADRWQSRLDAVAKDHQPVLSPVAKLGRIGTNEFAAEAEKLAVSFAANAEADRKLNALVARLFATNAPSSFAEVTERYRALFKQVDDDWRTLTEDAGKKHQASPTALPDASAEEVRQVLYAADSPTMVDWDLAYRLVPTPDQQRFRALQRKLDELEATHPGAPLRAMALVDNNSPYEPVIFKRGNPGSRGSSVPRQFLAALSGPNRTPFSHGSGRLDLARAIASRDNPLTARVLVNRVWLRYFGAPLVRTPSDFGVRSDPPLNPALLDHLAVWFMDHGWSLKQLHREILLSAAYQQASDPVGTREETEAFARNQKIDPGNNWLWRMNRKRLDFEALRDSLLAVAGKLDLTIGGQAVQIYNEQPAARRTIYGFIDRQNLPGLLRAFDFASPDTSSSQRFQTTVPQQALFMMNSPFVTDLAQRFVNRPEVRNARSDAERWRRLVEIACQRQPVAAETDAALRFAASHQSKPVPVSPASAWSYGLAEFVDADGRVTDFRPLPRFTGGTWQCGEKIPMDDARGYAQLTPDGGHPGRDAHHAVVRRWTASRRGFVKIEGELEHGAPEGDGVRGRVVSSRLGGMGSWTAKSRRESTILGPAFVEPGETIDFIVDCRADDAFDSFNWAPRVRFLSGPGDWDAKRDFTGPQPPAASIDAWTELAQALLSSNEFVFID
jgi:hypothetical protein